MKFNSVAAFLLSAALLVPTVGKTQERVVDLNVSQVQGKLNKTFNFTIGAGRANEGLRADWQQQLAEIKRDAGFKYIRMHGLLNDDMGIYKTDAKGNDE
ncbi:MAG: glycoside hydrolase, partial [Duganella sp.]